jgi:hypothetical protein
LQIVWFPDGDRTWWVALWTGESFEKFAQTLGPILEEAGITGGEPEELTVHNIVEGTKAATTTP